MGNTFDGQNCFPIGMRTDSAWKGAYKRDLATSQKNRLEKSTKFAEKSKMNGRTIGQIEELLAEETGCHRHHFRIFFDFDCTLGALDGLRKNRRNRRLMEEFDCIVCIHRVQNWHSSIFHASSSVEGKRKIGKLTHSMSKQ